MSRALRFPRLPEGPVSLVLASGEFSWLHHALCREGVQSIQTDQDIRLPQPVRFHPDLQVCPLPKKQMFALKGNGLLGRLQGTGLHLQETNQIPGNLYPKDVLCGGLAWGSWLIGNLKGMDPSIRQAAQQLGCEILSVRQGYCACSVALVDHQSCITADPGLERVLAQAGFDVLLIEAGSIQLPGYDTGFIGGCCGKLSPDKMAFTGSLKNHPSGTRIQIFLREHGVTPSELCQGPLIDVGGIIPLAEF